MYDCPMEVWVSWLMMNDILNCTACKDMEEYGRERQFEIVELVHGDLLLNIKMGGSLNTRCT